jgi:NAD(P)-dependent dehydrogenase (short-subunit alcohol dehydrogenase family)
MQLAGKTAIVTGAGQGIGKAIARRLAQQGAAVLVNDLLADRAETVASALRADNLPAIAFAADVSDEAAVQAMTDHALAEWDRVDILVNNAGYLRLSWVVDMPLEEWEQVFAVDARGVFLCCRAVLPSMIERRYGRIVTVASIAAYVTRPKEAHYCAAKAAAVQFTRVLAYEVAQYGITANVLCPGTTATEMVTETIIKDPVARGEWQASIPMGDFARLEDQADTVVFLASDQARHITGQVISVDGGQSLNWVPGIKSQDGGSNN